MELTNDEAKQVEYLAGLFYTPKQIAIIMEFDVREFVLLTDVDNSPVYLAYWKGYYEAEIEFRAQVKKLSNFGSSPAQTLLAKLIDQQKMDKADR